MMSHQPAPSANLTSIETLTKRGSEELQSGHLSKAIDCFEKAYKFAHDDNNALLVRVCAFNLGAVFIANRKPQKGLEYLEKAIPPANTNDGHSNGDLFYNFGLAYEIIGNKSESVKYLELSLEEYGKDKNSKSMEAEVASKIASLYLGLGRPLQAARAYGIAAAAHEANRDLTNQGQCLCHQAAALYRGNKPEEALQIADNCIMVCQKVSNNESLGKLYNELGLIYTQCSDFTRSLSCFELALPLSRGPKGDEKRQAVILQNLGAVYNSLGEYQRSLAFHESAAILHAELHNRSAQGQCFMNLAFAYSRLGNTEGAGECYLHALQAAKDTGDKHAQWQAMEGLGAVAFHDRNVERAVRYFQMSLAMLAQSQEKNPTAHDRLMAKMRDALQHQISEDDQSQKTKNYGKKTPFNPLDDSLNNSMRSRDGRRYSGGPRRSHSLDSRPSSKDEVDRNGQPIQPKSQPQTKAKPNHNKLSRRSLSGRRYSRRNPSPDKEPEGHGRRQVYLDPLLRPEDYDSEEEFKKRKKHWRKHSHSDCSISSSDEASADNQKNTNDNKKPPKPKPVNQRSDTDTEEERRRHQLQLEQEEELRRERLRSITVERQRRRDAESESDSTEGYRPRSRSESRPMSRIGSASRSRPKQRSRSLSSRSSNEELNLTEQTLSQYQRQLERAEDATETATSVTEESESETVTEMEEEEEATTEASETETEVENPNIGTATAGPPQFTAPHPPDSAKPNLVATYEKPQDAIGSRSPEMLSSRRGSRNYFKTGVTEGQGHLQGHHAQGVQGQGQGAGGKSLKFTQPDPNNPDYQTIRSFMKTNEMVPVPGPSHANEDPPELPPRNMSQLEGVLGQMSRSEQEEFLQNFNKKRREKSQEKSIHNDDDVELPVRVRSERNKSRACVVM